MCDDVCVTGIAYDPIMLRHQCICGDSVIHPEKPARIQQIFNRLEEAGLIAKCEVRIIFKQWC